MRRLGCLLLLLVIIVLAWLTREHWITIMPGGERPAATATTDSLWEPLTPDAAVRGKRAIDALNAPTGPVFVNLRPAEIAAYAFQTAGQTLPSAADSVQAAVIGDALYVRAIVPTKALNSTGALGPLAALLNDRERLSFGGSFRVIRPGLSEFQLREIKLRDFSVPRAAIPRLVQQITHRERLPDVSENALPVPTPPALGDVRIGDRRVTLYKTTTPVQ